MRHLQTAIYDFCEKLREKSTLEYSESAESLAIVTSEVLLRLQGEPKLFWEGVHLLSDLIPLSPLTSTSPSVCKIFDSAYEVSSIFFMQSSYMSSLHVGFYVATKPE